MVVWWAWKKPSLGPFAGYSVLLLAETVLLRKPFTGEHLKAGAILVMESVERPEESDSHKCDYVCTGRSTGMEEMEMEMERAEDCGWVECGD